MFSPLFAFIGVRYSGIKRKNQFISFISLTSMIGIALGVTVLITVLSVMNGFSKEIRAQMLSIAPHATLRAYDGYLKNWEHIIKDLKKYPMIKGVAPFIAEQGMLTSKGDVQGVYVVGILPKEINNVFPLENNIIAGSIDDLSSKKFSTIIGRELATKLGLWVGDKITILAPETNVSPAGVMPRLKRFLIVGIFDTGTNYDNTNIFINLRDASVLYRLNDGITGIQMKLVDELQAGVISKKIAAFYNHEYRVSNWTEVYSTYFKAIKMEKTVMWFILLLIIAVAGFNLVSSLVMMVTDKRPDIAILRTMGASRRSVMGIFMVQGTLIGFIGTLLGLIFGLLLANNVTQIVGFIENFFQVKFISQDVYFIGYLPSEIQSIDVILICLFSLIMSFVSTLYPAYRAGGVKPAEALRYE